MIDRLYATVITVLGLIPLLTFYAYQRWRHWRFELYADFPQPGRPDWKEGHWKWIHESIGAGDPRRSFDMVLMEQAPKFGNPAVLLSDMRPKEPPLLFILDAGVAEQITKATKQFSTSVPKTPNMKNLSPLVGERSLVNLDGDEWKDLRKRIIAGFAPQHLLSLTSQMLDKTQRFFDHLDRFVESGEEFGLGELTTNLAFDIIGIITFDSDLKAQIPGEQSPVLIAYRECQGAFLTPRFSKVYPKWWMDRHVNAKSKKLDSVLKNLIREEFDRKIQGATKSRSAMALSLQHVEDLTPQILQQTSDTLRGFLFAGHDTTSILMQWAFYELGRCPHALRTLRDELDGVFGDDPHPAAVRDKLLAPGGEKLLTRLPYTDAIVKEILRLYPPGGTARMAPQGSGTTLTMPDGKQLLVDGMTMTPIAKIIQRDPAIFGEDANEFVPDRWLREHNIPESAWRPYERGPRRCTGLELANMEARLTLACTARQYDFVKTGLGELEVDEKGRYILDDQGCYKTKSTLFTTSYVTAKPLDGTMMKVKLSEKAKSRTQG
ncbi:unnamed protein product [Discula destructiva]